MTEDGGRRILMLEQAVGALGPRPPIDATVRQFRPPERFAGKTFASYHPAHPTQTAAAAHLRQIAANLHPATGFGALRDRIFGRPREHGGVYLDGGFGVGKTHLLASLWNDAPEPRAYLSFDELMYLIGMVGPGSAASAFRGHSIVAIDEWELDDPGNLTMAIAFLRSAVAQETFVAVTSNTLPLELGSGRFSQKDFQAEIVELASAFEVLRIEGDDYRHRHFEAQPGADYFTDAEGLARFRSHAPEPVLATSFAALLAGLESIHPIRFRDLVGGFRSIAVEDITTIPHLAEALRWVHFVDSAYDASVRMQASGSIALADIFPERDRTGPFGKKLSRCLSRLEEMLAVGTGEAPAREASVERD